MTTSVKVHVNGRYRAHVVQRNADGSVHTSVQVEGAYDGSPNPSGERIFQLPHPARATFEVSEEYLGEKMVGLPKMQEQGNKVVTLNESAHGNE